MNDKFKIIEGGKDKPDIRDIDPRMGLDDAARLLGESVPEQVYKPLSILDFDFRDDSSIRNQFNFLLSQKYKLPEGNPIINQISKSIESQVLGFYRQKIADLLNNKADGYSPFSVTPLGEISPILVKPIDLYNDFLRSVDNFSYSDIMDYKEIARGFLKEKFEPLANDFNLLVDEVAGVLEKHSKTTKTLGNDFSATDIPSELPEKAPALFAHDRQIDPQTNKLESPIVFYNRVWQPYIKADLIFRDDLKSADPHLYAKMSEYCSNHKIDRDTVFPPKPTERDARILQSADKQSEEYIAAASRMVGRQRIAAFRAKNSPELK